MEACAFRASDNARQHLLTWVLMQQVLAPLAIGLTVFISHIVGIPVTNCCINRAHSCSSFAWLQCLSSSTNFIMYGP